MNTANQFFIGNIIRESDPFISVWDTTNTSSGSSASNEIELPLIASGSSYSFWVDWGDGSPREKITSGLVRPKHTYSISGVYEIEITGIIRGWAFNNTLDRLKIIEVKQWGPLKFLSVTAGLAFYGCANMDITATDVMNTIGLTNMTSFFRNCSSLVWNSSVGLIDTSVVTQMANMFDGATLFNQPLGTLDISNVTNMTSWIRNTSMVQDLSALNPINMTTATQFALGTNMGSTNYDALLNSWAGKSLQSGVTFHAGSAKYSTASASARASIISTYGWTITDGGPV